MLSIYQNHAGPWNIIALENPDIAGREGFSQVLVSEEKMTFSRSANKYDKKFDVNISIHRTPEGILYLDEKGTELTKFDPRNGVIETLSFHGFKNMWNRPGDSAITKQQCW